MIVLPEVIAFVAGFPILLAHLALTLAVFVAAAAILSLTSRGEEVQQVRDGNPASAVLYGASLLALALPAAKALSASTGFLDILLWCGASELVQLVLFTLADLVLAGLTARVRDEEDMAAAVLLGAARLALAVLLSAGLTV
jgi:putative membrane protein